MAWWRHQMEAFSTLLAICAGNSPIPVNSPHKGQWRGALMFTLICVWINGWVNNVDAFGWGYHIYIYIYIYILQSYSISNTLVTDGFPAQRDSNTSVPLWRIVVRINTNYIACKWSAIFVIKIWVSYLFYLTTELERCDKIIIFGLIRIKPSHNFVVNTNQSKLSC